MNETIKTILNHRSIREFTDEAVDPKVIELLVEVAQHTATSMGLQSSAIVRVTDPEKKKQIMEVAKQEYVARAPELWVFIVDNYRNVNISKQKGSEPDLAYGMDHFFSGFTDAALTASNVLTSIESLGLGGVFIGNVLNDPTRIIEILDLPEGTFPVVGLLFGKPNQAPELKPRMPMEFRFFENSYVKRDDYVEALEDYDTVMHTYYDLRNANQRVDTFTDQVVKKYKVGDVRRNQVLEDAQNNGFQLLYKPESKDDGQ